MSRYDSNDKDELYDILWDFLIEHPILDLLNVLRDVVENQKRYLREGE